MSDKAMRDQFVTSFREQFGERAIRIAERQRDAAGPDERDSWSQIIASLQRHELQTPHVPGSDEVKSHFPL